MSNRSDIRLSVYQGEGGIDEIRWQADEGPEPGEQSAKAMILALWDAERRNALRIDLWAKDLTVDDMNDFVFQTLMSLADTYQNATNDRGLMAEIKLFAREFAEKASKAALRQGRAPGA